MHSSLLVPAAAPCVIFYHIGKAGGESIHHWADEAGVKLYTRYKQLDPNAAHPPSDRGIRRGVQQIYDAELIMGHWDLEPEYNRERKSRNLPIRKCLRFTMLRDPPKQLTSWLYFKYGNQTPEYFMDCIAETPRGICDVWPDNREPLCRALAAWGNCSHQEWGTCDVAAATRAIEQMDFVGFTERHDESIQALSFALNKTNIPFHSHHNHRTKYNAGFYAQTPELQEEIIRATQISQHVYEWALLRSTKLPDSLD